MRDRDPDAVASSYPDGPIRAPDDLYVSPDVRVAFLRFAGPASAAYSDDNAVVMRFVDAESGAPATHNTTRVSIEIMSPDDAGAEAWTEVGPWSDDGGDYVILLGRTYRVLSPDRTPLFRLCPPLPRRELARVEARHAMSYCPRIHRMLLGAE